MELALAITLNKTLVFTLLHGCCGCQAAPGTGTSADAGGHVEGLAMAGVRTSAGFSVRHCDCQAVCLPMPVPGSRGTEALQPVPMRSKGT